MFMIEAFNETGNVKLLKHMMVIVEKREDIIPALINLSKQMPSSSLAEHKELLAEIEKYLHLDFSSEEFSYVYDYLGDGPWWSLSEIKVGEPVELMRVKNFDVVEMKR